MGSSLVPAKWRDGWYVLPQEVTWKDLDAVGHVNNAVYFTYFESARTRYWLEMTGGSGPLSIGFIVAYAECAFLEQLELMEQIEILVRVGEMRRTSLDFEYEIRHDGDKLAAKGTVVVVLYSWGAKSKLPITDELRRMVATFQKSE
ncbi:MAG TPA: acyl-CoA thioesterase [Thermoanaerobaculia bacterium]|nr:acyl-CoA thioesterase [Thermoanaerobaculia bacterium]